MEGKQVFWPIVAMLLGTIILMINFGYLPRTVVRYWPVLIIIWGLIKVADYQEPKKTKRKR